MQHMKRQIKGMRLQENMRERTNSRKRCQKYHFSNHKMTGIGTKHWNKTKHIMSKSTSTKHEQKNIKLNRNSNKILEQNNTHLEQKNIR